MLPVRRPRREVRRPAAAASGAGPARVRRPAWTGNAAFTAFGTVLDGISRAPGERLLWTPFCALAAALASAARPERQDVRATSVTTGGR